MERAECLHSISSESESWKLHDAAVERFFPPQEDERSSRGTPCRVERGSRRVTVERFPSPQNVFVPRHSSRWDWVRPEGPNSDKVTGAVDQDTLAP